MTKEALEKKENTKDFLEQQEKLKILKKIIGKTQKELNLAKDVSDLLESFCENLINGKKFKIIEESEIWNITQTAKFLGVTRPTVYKMIERGDLQSIKCEGTKIIPSSVTAYLKRKEKAHSLALKKLHATDMLLKESTRELLPISINQDDFEEIDF